MSKPAVRRTYGKLPVRSSSSLFDHSSSPPPSFPSPYNGRSSTPPSSSRLESPSPSSPSPVRRPVLRSTSSSPLFLPHDDEDDEENCNTLQSSNVSPALDGDQGSAKKQTAVKMKPRPAKKAVQSTLKGFFAPIPAKRKRPLQPTTTVPATSNFSSTSASTCSTASSSKDAASSSSSKSTPLTQLHLTHLRLLHTCPDCSMSYMRGGEDESIHRAHHSKVLRGIPWEGLGKGKGKGKSTLGETGWKVIKDDVEFGPKSGGLWKVRAKGRIVMIDGSWGGAKLDEILSTVDLVLSSPPLPLAILDQCKIFLFVTSSPAPPPSSSSAKRPRLDMSHAKSLSSSASKERIVSVVVAQGIKTAMRVLRNGERVEGGVESGGFGSVTCDPEQLPTPLGIHRLYTSPLYRSHGISYHLLNAACQHTVYGCSFSPEKSEVAFSQPTESGRTVMEKWGKGGVRVFVDDERQL
ncbi:hypothetical protein CI109_101109 [Kwoniella shandongensis]|uniref:Uncharacterized protein n=1 Tax=Kwoniella shandongensis TaxID=1734106 RepID=A0A5M6C598_9TREE|nr:uncharacterized protein CI109_001579 [Kwoniella shandongensis]KAA5530173.1 hypothetical protein CI109_001579 [Kwoniella shandongensis]